MTGRPQRLRNPWLKRHRFLLSAPTFKGQRESRTVTGRPRPWAALHQPMWSTGPRPGRTSFRGSIPERMTLHTYLGKTTLVHKGQPSLQVEEVWAPDRPAMSPAPVAGVSQTDDDQYAYSEELTGETDGPETTPVLGTGETVQTMSIFGNPGDDATGVDYARCAAGRRHISARHSGAGGDRHRPLAWVGAFCPG